MSRQMIPAVTNCLGAIRFLPVPGCDGAGTVDGRRTRNFGCRTQRVVYTGAACSSRRAASASSANCCTTWKNFGVCPKNNPSAVNDAIVATAPPNLSSLGRITAQCGKSGLMNSQGTGKIRLG